MVDQRADARADAIVVGAGVIGSAVTLELSRRGLQTVCVDKAPAAGYGSTSSSSAIVRFTYSTFAGVAMAWEGMHYWRDWETHVGPQDTLAEFIPVPMVLLKEAGGHHERVQPLLDEVGVPYVDMDRPQFESAFPHFDIRRFGPAARLEDDEAPFWGEPTAYHDGALVMHDSGYISDPQLAAQNLATAAKAAGAEFRFGSAVVGIDRVGGRATGVRLDDGSTIGAPIVVNVAGPHSSIIDDLAGVSAAIRGRALRREVYVVPAPGGLDYEVIGPMCGDLDTGVYFRPESGNNVLISNSEPECDELEWVEDPDDCREMLTEDEFLLHVLRTARRMPELRVPHAKRGLVSMYDATPDWLPVYDRTDLGGYYQAIGTSGNQFKNAAIAGHCMAELIKAVESGHDHDADPLRIIGPHTGLPIDLGTFSRNRPFDPDAVNTVMG